MADKEGARKSGVEMVVSTSPDVCKTPMGSSTPPVPYQVVGMMSQATGTTSTVNFTSMPVFTKASKIPMVTGDEPGVATGVKSGTVMGTAEPDQSSSTVQAEDQKVCRHDDLFAMNNDNTKGKLVCMEVGPGGGGAGDSGGESSEFDEAGQCGDANTPTAPETPAEQTAIDAIAEQAAQAPNEQSWWSTWSERLHTGLDVAGMVPIIGEGADGINAVIYLFEADLVNAGVSAAALWPWGGQVATGGRLTYKGGKAVAKEVGQEGAQKLGKELTQKSTKKAAGQADNTIKASAGGDAPPASGGGGTGGSGGAGGGGSGGGGRPPGDKPPDGGGGGPKKRKKPKGESGDSSTGSDGVRVSGASGPKSVDELLEGSTKGKVGKSKQYNKKGGIDQANSDFDSLTSGREVTDHGNGVRSATLSDGSTVSVRPTSRTGNPTIQVNPSSGKAIKVRYGK